MPDTLAQSLGAHARQACGVLRILKEVAAQLGISYSTVHTHIERIYEKLHVHSRSDAIAKYLKP